MVFQRPNPFPLSVFDNVAYGLRCTAKGKAELEEAVETSLRATLLWDALKDRLQSPRWYLPPSSSSGCASRGWRSSRRCC